MCYIAYAVAQMSTYANTLNVRSTMVSIIDPVHLDSTQIPDINKQSTTPLELARQESIKKAFYVNCMQPGLRGQDGLRAALTDDNDPALWGSIRSSTGFGVHSSEYKILGAAYVETPMASFPVVLFISNTQLVLYAPNVPMAKLEAERFDELTEAQLSIDERLRGLDNMPSFLIDSHDNLFFSIREMNSIYPFLQLRSVANNEEKESISTLLLHLLPYFIGYEEDTHVESMDFVTKLTSERLLEHKCFFDIGCIGSVTHSKASPADIYKRMQKMLARPVITIISFLLLVQENEEGPGTSHRASVCITVSREYYRYILMYTMHCCDN